LPPIKPTIKVPTSLIDRFRELSNPNTSRGIETLGYILGKYSQQHRAVTATVLLLPRQAGTREACWVVAIDPGDPGEEPWMTKQTELHEMEELKTIGWIHTHPSFTCFFSNVDSHSNALH